jgi:hypothetical protein
MGNVNDSGWLLLVLAIVLALLFFKRREVREAAVTLAETFRREMANFPRGGPPTPMHPSPAGDDAILRRRASKDVKG